MIFTFLLRLYSSKLRKYLYTKLPTNLFNCFWLNSVRHVDGKSEFPPFIINNKNKSLKYFLKTPWAQETNKMSTNPAVVNTGNDALPSSYPDLDATSPTDSVIAGDFGQMSSADQVSSYIY